MVRVYILYVYNQCTYTYIIDIIHTEIHSLSSVCIYRDRDRQTDKDREIERHTYIPTYYP